jgi:NDP-sugar pyrophosphorylase family protein
MTMAVAVLAGGLATRLGDVSRWTPKCLVEVAGRPFAVHLIERFASAGYTNLVFCIGHMGDQVKAELGDGSTWGVRIRYSEDGPTQLGTGGAIRNALPLLGDAFFVQYGDAYLRCDYGSIEAAFRSAGRLGLMTVFRNQGRWDRSNVVFSSGRIVEYDKSRVSPAMDYIDYGLGALRPAAFDPFPAGQAFDLADVYADLIRRDQLAGFEVFERFYEIGSVAGLEDTSRFLTTGVPA